MKTSFPHNLQPFRSILFTMPAIAIIGAMPAAAAFNVGAKNLVEGPGACADTVCLGVSPQTAAWTASASDPWLHVPGGGVGSSNVVFSCDANTNGTRTGTLSIAGQTVSITQAGTNYVLARPVVTLTLSGLVTPSGLAVDGMGNVFIADDDAGAIEEWTPPASAVSSLVTGLNSPRQLALDGAGNVYFTDTGNNMLKEWVAASNSVVTLVSSGLSNPRGVAVEAATNVYIGDANDNAVKKWSNGGLGILISSNATTPLFSPRGVAVDASGNVYVADNGNSAIKEWQAASGNVVTVVTPSSVLWPYSVAVDGGGNVYFTDTGNNAIREFVAASNMVVPLVTSGLNVPNGVAVDGAGNVYIADTNDHQVKEQPRAFVSTNAVVEDAAAGNGVLPPVLPAGENLAGVFAPTSDSSWLTITGVTNGVVSFSFAATTVPVPRTANISVLGVKVPVVQQPFIFTETNGAITVSGFPPIGNLFTTLTIPSTIAGYPVTAITGFSVYPNVTSVTIPDSVMSIGDNAFYGCQNLSTVTMGNSITNIGIGAFENCAVENLTIPNSVVRIGDSAFANSGLYSVTIGNHVTSIGNSVFLGCWGLTSVTIPNNVTSVGDNAFRECYGLRSVTIPNSVYSLGANVFYGCTALTNLVVGNSVTNIGIYAFQSCARLHQAYFLGNAPTVNGAAGSADSSVFQGESGTAYYVPGTAGWGATYGGFATAVWSDPNFGYVLANGAITITGYSGGVNAVIPATIHGYPVTAIGPSAFYEHTELSGVTIPDSVTSIGNSAFFNCMNLYTLTLGSGVTNIGSQAFGGCIIGSLAIPNSVLSIESGAFSGSALNPLTIGNHVISIGDGAFSQCQMTSVTIPDSVISIGASAFYDCFKVRNLVIGGHVNSIGNKAFSGCNLATVTIPASVTNIGTNAFLNCLGQYGQQLNQAYFQGAPPSVNGKAGSADTSVFQGESGTVYYVPGTPGWGATYGGWPTVGSYYLPKPQIFGGGLGAGTGTKCFNFTISWATNTAMVVEASTNLVNWSPLTTNTLVSGTNAFNDSTWTNCPQRFYRVRSP